jgi:methylmalonyl-CoA/ethylmalonyl-CoA epimerase
MPKIKRIDHIAIVVEDIELALHFWRDVLGLELQHVEDVPDQKSIVAFLPTGASEVELVKPTSEDSGISRYLKKRGPGIHHICFEVDDIEATLVQLKMKGIHLINERPIFGTGGKRIAFIHPDSTHGVLIELYELTPQEPEIRMQRARGLAERVITSGVAMRNAALVFLRALLTDNDGNGDDKNKAASKGMKS